MPEPGNETPPHFFTQDDLQLITERGRGVVAATLGNLLLDTERLVHLRYEDDLQLILGPASRFDYQGTPMARTTVDIFHPPVPPESWYAHLTDCGVPGATTLDRPVAHGRHLPIRIYDEREHRERAGRWATIGLKKLVSVRALPFLSLGSPTVSRWQQAMKAPWPPFVGP